MSEIKDLQDILYRLAQSAEADGKYALGFRIQEVAHNLGPLDMEMDELRRVKVIHGLATGRIE